MKRIQLILLTTLLITTLLGSAQIAATDFVTRWSGFYAPIGSNAIHIPVSPSYAYNYDVDWDNDGVFDDLGVTDSITHVYPSGSHQFIVRIRGTFPAIAFGNSTVKDEVLDVIRWGNVGFKDFTSAFENCLTANFCAFDTPTLDTTANVSFKNAFKGTNWFSCSIGSTNINSWDMSSVTDMSGMFQNTLVPFPGLDVSSWDVSSVVDMSNMFKGTIDFAQVNLSAWDVSKVVDMSGMFAISDFAGNISSWNVSAVTNMDSMLLSCHSFDQNLGNWQIDSVLSMEDMLNSSGLSIANYDSTLIGWTSSAHQSNVSLGAQNLIYCNAINARNQLINDGWSISGDTTNCITSLKEFDMNKFRFYPNPTTGILNIEGLYSPTNIEVFSLEGKFIEQVILQNGQVNLTGLPCGAYIVKVGISTKKVMIE